MAKSFELKGLKETLGNLERFKVDTLQDLDDELTATAFQIRAEAVRATPVDLGNLRQSVDVVNKPFDKNVVARANYAAYVEFGTGTLVDVPQGLEDYAIQFKGKNVKQVNLPARPYMFPPFFRNTKELPNRLKKIIEQNGRRK